MKIYLAILGALLTILSQTHAQGVKATLLNGECVSVKTNGVLFQCVPFDRPANPLRRGERDGRRVFLTNLPASLHPTTTAFLKVYGIPKGDTVEVDGQTVEHWMYVGKP
jgi:hypothetical protein